MINKYYDTDCNLGLLDGKTIAVMGFGSQGHAHAMNLKESGMNVIVGLRKDSASVKIAEQAGLTVMPVCDAARKADIVMMLVPDEKAPSVYKEEVEPYLEEGNMIMFAHGFNIPTIRYSLLQTWMSPWSRQKDPGIRSEASMKKAKAYQASSPCIRIIREKQKTSRWPMQPASERGVQAFWRRRSKKRRKPTCSESRLCCAAGLRNS